MASTDWKDSEARNAARTRARIAARVVEVTGWIAASGGIAGGIYLVATASHYVNETQARLIGVEGIVGSVVIGSWIIMVAAFVQSRTKKPPE